MTTRLFRLTFLVFLLFVSACGTLIPPPSATQPDSVTGTLSSPENSTATLPAPETSRDLRVWLPAQFDPDADSDAARSLKARLDQFAKLHPEISLDIRIKDEVEPASLLEMLSLARAAAPDTLPDLVALPRADLEDAALKSIIHPIEGLTDTLDEPGWYSYARQLAHAQNSAYGLPFAGDALVFAYDPAKFSNPPESWDTILNRPGGLALLGEKPQITLLISLYRSMNGALLDAQNRPTLEEFALEPTLAFVEKARINRSQFVDSEEAAWQELLAGRVAWTVTTVSRVLADPSDKFQIAPLPGLNNEPYTLGTSWAWALAGADPENETLAIELADWLVQDQFLNTWINQAGFLPVRSADINERFPALATVAESAQPVPSNDVLAALEPVLREAVIRILDGEPLDVVTLAALEALK
jgi:multiple sugar transport system substrate-binding protein